jgi:hypothetical protein
VSKIVKEVPAAQYGSLRDPWYDEQLDGNIRLIDPADWQGRFGSARSCATSLRQAAERRGLGCKVSVRGEDVYVEPLNGTPVKKAAVKKTVAKKVAPAKKAAAKRPPKQAA